MDKPVDNLRCCCGQPVDNFRVVDNLCTAYAQPVENLWITGGGGGGLLAFTIVVATYAQNKSKLGKLR